MAPAGPRALWLSALVLGVGLRAVYLLTPGLDSDMAIVGLMARHILDGEFPVFFWGQPFAGTIESYLAAALFAVIGPSRFALALSPFLVSLAFLLVTERLARDGFGREAGRLALLLAAVPAPFLVVHSVTARSNYIENLVLGSLLLLLALRLPREAGPGRRRGLFLLGLTGGLAWYESPQSIHYLLAAGLFLLLRGPRLLGRRDAAIVPPAFLLGSLPFWLYNLQAPVTSTFGAIYAQAGRGDLLHSLARYLTEKVPYVLGAVGQRGDVHFSMGDLLFALYAAAFLFLLCTWRAPGSQLVLLFLIVTSAIVVAAYNQGGTTRYLLPLYSVLPVMMAAFLVRLRRLSVPIFATAVAGLLLTSLASNLLRAEALDPTQHALYRAQREQEARLVDFLRGEGLTRVYVLDFWDAYRLTFDAQETVVFAEPGPSFYPPHTAAVDGAARYGYVVKGVQTVQDFEDTLRGVGVTYRNRRVSGYTVFDAFQPPAGPPVRALARRDWRGSASHAATDPDQALDGDPFTSWRSGRPAQPEASYQVDLGRVRTIGRVALLPGRSPSPIGSFRIEGSTDGERWQPGLAFPGLWRSLMWTGSRLQVDSLGGVETRFPPLPARWVRVTFLRGGEGTEWSIRELFVSEVGSEAGRPAAPVAAAYDRGRADEAEQRWPDAVRALQAAVDHDPDWEPAQRELLLAAERLGVDQEDLYERAVALEARGLGPLAARVFWQAAQAFPHSNHSDPLRRLLQLEPADGHPGRLAAVQQRLQAFVPAEPVAARFGGKLALLGYSVDPREVPPGGRVRLSYFWQCLGAMDQDYVVFVHLRGEGGGFGDDHAPLEGLYPTSRWKTGEVVREDRTLVIPGAIKPGPLALTVGVWDPKSGRRLRVEGAAGDDKVRVTQLSIRAPAAAGQ
jgi:hypothetical protein